METLGYVAVATGLAGWLATTVFAQELSISDVAIFASVAAGAAGIFTGRRWRSTSEAERAGREAEKDRAIRAETGLAEALGKLDTRDEEVDRLRQEVAKLHDVVSTVGGAKVFDAIVASNVQAEERHRQTTTALTAELAEGRKQMLDAIHDLRRAVMASPPSGSTS